MRAKILHWSVTFYIGITLISCKTTNIIEYRAEQNDGVSAPTNIKYKSLSPYEFSPWLAKILTPEIFSQSNPLTYLLDRILNGGYAVIKSLDADVKFCLHKKKFPSYYVPYAELMSSILICGVDLLDLRRAIFDIRNPADSRSLSVSLPVEDLEPELPGLFSPDIFSDPNPPLIIFNKTMNLEEDAILDLILELQDISRSGELQQKYATYAKALASLLQNRREYKVLREYNSKMKNASSAVAPTK